MRNSDAIFQTVSILFEKFSDSPVVPVIFDPFVYTINPLFLIALMGECQSKKKVFMFDTRQISDFNQKRVQHFFRQQLDLERIELNLNDAWDKDTISKNTVISKVDATPEAIAFKSNKKYQILPIMSLRNLPSMATRRDDGYLYNNDNIEPEEKRKSYYSRFALYQDNLQDLQKYQRFMRISVDDFLKFLNLGTKNLVTPLSTILYELIDNIRKHTPETTNGFFSFSRNKKLDKNDNVYFEYQLIIADNDEIGLPNKYLNELTKERDKLINNGISNSVVSEHYGSAISELSLRNTSDDIRVLDTLYGNDSIRITHQIPRVAMHFGIPMLLRMIKAFFDKKSSKNLLEIFTHRDNRFYKTIYDSKGNFKKTQYFERGIEGTYIILTFTDRINPYQDENKEKNYISNIKNQDYEIILEKHDKFQKQISDFRVVNALDDYVIKNEEKIIIDASKFQKTFSELIREIYLAANKHSLTDIVVVNFSFQDIMEHLKLMAHIIYDNMEKPYEKIINILFYDNKSPGVIFLGGKYKLEFLSIANILKSHYQIDTGLGLKIDEDLNNEIDIDSKLFYKNFLLPFEIFRLIRHENPEETMDLLQTMVENFLNNNAIKKDIHIDTHAGYHIDRFLEFKQLFEDSRWVKRLAFRLAAELHNASNTNNEIILYGLDKYTNMLLALTKHFMKDLDKNVERFYLGDIISDKEIIVKRIGNLEPPPILVASVVLDGSRINIDKAKTISIIQLVFDNIDMQLSGDITPLLQIKNRGKVYPVFKDKDRYCDRCTGAPQRVMPLLDILNSDPFRLDCVYFDGYTNKKIKSYTDENKISTKWKDSIYFGHVERGSNHFLHYVDTVSFYEQNIDQIEAFLKKKYEAIKKKSSNYANVLILSSMHDTNNMFVALINKKLFDNEAVVLSFDKVATEDNFHLLDAYGFKKDDTYTLFVDDSLASGYTAEYFYLILKKIFKDDNVSFDKIFILIDRMSNHDEGLLSHYLKSKDLEDVHPYTTLEIRPIKTELEDCFLCNRKKEYIQLARLSSLDLTTFQMARKARRLKKIFHKEARDSKEQKLQDKIKVYIKTVATDYIYWCYSRLSRSEYFLKDFKQFYEEFSDKIQKDISDEFKKEFIEGRYELKLIEKVIEFESEIALLKALSFPKTSYYYELKSWVVEVVIGYLVGRASGPFELKYIFSTLQDKDSEELDDFEKYYKKKTNIHKINAYFSILGHMKDSKLLDVEMIRLYYKMTQVQIEDKTTLHTYPFTVKMTIAGNIEKAKFIENNLIQIKKENGSVLGARQFTLLNALQIENTLYLEDYLVEKIKNQAKTPEFFEDDNDFNNIKDFENFDKYFSSIFKKENLGEKTKSLKSLFAACNLGKDIHFFIAPQFMIDYGDYKKYLEDSENQLIDLFDDFASLEQLSDTQLIKDVKMIYRGAIVDEKDKAKKTKPIKLRLINNNELVTKIDDTWANAYNDNYVVIRLTKIDENLLMQQKQIDGTGGIKNNSPVWFRPIGCVVIEMPNMNHKLHMDITRTVLVIKSYLLDFLAQVFSRGVIQEAIHNKEKERRQKAIAELQMAQEKIESEKTIKELEAQMQNLEEEKNKFELEINDYVIRVSNLGHNYSENIKIMSKINDMQKDSSINDEQIIEHIKYYTHGLEYVFNSASLGNSNGTTNLADSLFFSLEGKERESFKYRIEKFIESAPYFIDNCDYKTQKFSLESFDYDLNNVEYGISAKQLTIIVYELIYNAVKSNPKDINQINFKIVAEDQVLYIANNGNEIQDDKQKILFKKDSTNQKHGNGLPRIHKFLNKYNIHIGLASNIPVFLEGYIVVFEIKNKG